MIGRVGYAQSDPQFSQYMFNGLIVNPALAGSKEQISSSFLFKRHWTGMANIAPVIQSFNIHAPFQYQRIGLGLQVVNESFSIQNRLSASASYAYKINFASGILSFGISAGFIQSSIRYSQLVVLDEEKDYRSDINAILPDLGTGIYYQSKYFYAGISALHLLPNAWKYSNHPLEIDIVKRHFYLMAGYRWQPSEKVQILPTTLIKYVSGQCIQADATVHIKYNDFIWGGFSVRTNNAFSLQGGLKISDFFTLTRQSIKVGYAYDWSDNSLNKVWRGSHEIMLILDIGVYQKPSKIRRGKINISPVLF